MNNCINRLSEIRNGITALRGDCVNTGCVNEKILREFGRIQAAIDGCPVQPIKFVFFDGFSWTSMRIKWFTRSRWSHEAIMMNGDNGKLIEAWHNPAHNNKLEWCHSHLNNHTKGTPYEVWAMPVSKDLYNACMFEWCRYANNNEPYDFLAIYGFLLKFRRDGHGMICSEGCNKPLIEKMNLDINPAHVSPEDGYRMIQYAGAELIHKGEV